MKKTASNGCFADYHRVSLSPNAMSTSDSVDLCRKRVIHRLIDPLDSLPYR
jgi:hypothetical protein